jgi:hypothetical protein
VNGSPAAITYSAEGLIAISLCRRFAVYTDVLVGADARSLGISKALE